MPEKFGEQFLHKRDSKFHTNEAIEKTKKRKGVESQKPADKIAAHLERLDSVLGPEPLENDSEFNRKERNINVLKRGLYNSIIIKPEDIPEGYFENQRRIAREQGHGDIEITDELKEQTAEVIISDQKSTLNNWIEYFTSSDSESYPMWAKFWAFQGMLNLSSYDKEKHSFGKRRKDTVSPFPDLNREALAYTVDVIVKKVNRENVSLEQADPEFQKLLQGANFGKLYAWAIEKVTPAGEYELLEIKGEWIKYDKNSDHMPLVESLGGHGTGWCTAGETTAQSQLKGGDFYVYYSYDNQDKPTIPRIAIRMQENEIAEVRGIAHEQNLDPQIAQTDILEGKLKEFGKEGERYQKKIVDMKRLTAIEKKHKEGQDLSKNDLSFLYEIDSNIQGFGYRKDPRIKEIEDQRNIKKDLAFVLDFSEDEISLTREEALKGGIKYHYGNLDFNNFTSVENLKLPETVGGDIYLRSLTSVENLKLPETVKGDLYLRRLTSVKNLKLPEIIRGSLYLDDLIAPVENLKLPKIIGGSLYLDSLSSVKKDNLRKQYPDLEII